ncbi:hypothetical protein ACWD1Y_34640 [Streptomyces sp. NPDC002814]
MPIADRTILVTGANRGVGQALVEEALRRGAKRVCAAAQSVDSLSTSSSTTPAYAIFLSQSPRALSARQGVTVQAALDGERQNTALLDAVPAT